MKRIALLCLLALCAGCRTVSMKGTPFYADKNTTYDPKAVAERVNLWPVAYYQKPALSVLWPIGAFTDTETAVRPLFSLQRDKPGAPYDYLYVLGPLAEFNWKRHRHHVFPVFWGKNWNGGDYLNVFPLYWSESTDASGTRLNAFFPFWIYDRSTRQTDLDVAWPFYHQSRSGDGSRSKTRLWPFLSHETDARGDSDSWSYLFYLGRTSRQAGALRSYFFPFYAYDGSDDSFLSLLYARRNGWTVLPPLLSGWADGGEAGRALLGLGGWDGSRSWAFPLYYANPTNRTFVSLPYAHGPDWGAVPPLLSWWSRGGEAGRALLGLGGWDGPRSWAFPLYYRNAASDTFVTPLWAHEGERWSAVPPLLSWWSGDGEAGRVLLGLGGWEHGDHWVFPFYYASPTNRAFVSLPYAHGRSWGAVPPLLSWWSRGGDSGRVLLGLGGWDGPCSWAFPFYRADGDSFLSPLYCATAHGGGIPLLLTEWNDRGRFLSPLYFRSESGANVLPPLLTGWWKDGFASPLWSRWNHDGDKVTLWYTPLVGTRTGRTRASWIVPLYMESDGPRESWQNVLLLAHHSHDKRNGSRSYGLFPLYSFRSRAPHSALERALDAPALDAADLDAIFDGESYRWDMCAEWTPELSDVPENEWWRDGLRSHSDTNRYPTAFRSTSRHHSALLSLFTADSSVEARRGAFRVGDRLVEDGLRLTARSDSDFPFLWNAEARRTVWFDPATGSRLGETERDESSLLLFLHDTKREHDVEPDGTTHDYFRRRVLWRLWHYEELDGDTSLDIFPAITHDTRKDGYRKTSFLWRLFRYERDPAAGTRKLDLLFLPILR